MADAPPQSPARDGDATEYWCYHCDRRVSVESVADLPDVVCEECKNGFVEAIPAIGSYPVTAETPSIGFDEPSFGDQFLQVLRLIHQASPEGEEAPDLERPSDEDFLRIELDGWDDHDEDEDEDEDDEEAIENEVVDEDRNEELDLEEEEDGDGDGEDRSGDENEDRRDGDDDEVEDLRRRQRDVLRLRIRDLATRARSGRNRILDWAEILMGLEDNSIEFRLEIPEPDRYIGDPEDYVDAAGYEALLQNLAETDGGRRGAPPASKSVVSSLPALEISSPEDSILCAICKDMVAVGESATKLPCGHGYHGDCIVPWLGSRNTCPVCRFELSTDDSEYEEEKKKKKKGPIVSASGASGSGGAS